MSNDVTNVIAKHGKGGVKTAPKPPERLQKEGKKLWRQVWENAGDILKASDIFAIERLCVLSDREFALQNELTVLGRSWYKMNKVTLAEHPVSKMLTEVRKEMTALLRECGLTPSSRTRIETEVSGHEEIMAALIAANSRNVSISKREEFK